MWENFSTKLLLIIINLAGYGHILLHYNTTWCLLSAQFLLNYGCKALNYWQYVWTIMVTFLEAISRTMSSFPTSHLTFSSVIDGHQLSHGVLFYVRAQLFFSFFYALTNIAFYVISNNSGQQWSMLFMSLPKKLTNNVSKEA